MMTFFGASRQVPLGLLNIRKQAGRFDDYLGAQLFPGQLRGLFGADHPHFLAVNHQHIVLGFVRGRLFRADRALEAALGRIVLEQVGQVVGRDDIAHRDDFNVLANQTLFDQRPIDQASNAAESVNCYFYCHISVPIGFSSIQFHSVVIL